MHYLEPGTVIAQNFQVVTKIGEGGMGSVYLGVDLAANKQVALKTLARNLDNHIALGRFRRETQALVKLNHQNIARVHSWGMHQEKMPYLVMELFDGLSLSEYLKARGPLSHEEALLVFKDIVSALQYAHFMGIIHRDIKPSNIVLNLNKEKRPCSAKLVDFGLVQFVSNNQTLTNTGDIVGSPLYMSPEQWNGVYDQRSDIYSLGCTIYEALRGAPPFQGESPFATFIMHERADIPRLEAQRFRPAQYQDWDIVIAAMMAKDPLRRYQSVAAIKDDLIRMETGEHPTGHSPRPPKQKPKPAWARALALGLASISLLVTAELFREPAAKPSLISTEDSPLARVTVSHGSNTSIWHFPRNQSLGIISTVYEKAPHKAIGDVELANEPLKLLPDEVLIKNPGLISPQDQLQFICLEFDGRICDINDKELSAFVSYKNISVLNICNTSITQASLPTIQRFSKLSALTCGGTDLTGAHLLQFENLDKLATLNAPNTADISKVLPALAHCRKLENLGMRGDEITDSDLKLIARCHSLRRLSLGKNKAISARGLRYLASLPDLQDLELENLKMSAEMYAAIATMKHLRTLEINAQAMDEAAVKKFEDLQKSGIRIQFVHDLARDLSMGISRIFHLPC